MILDIHSFNFLLYVMAFIAVIVFVALYFVEAGYGKMISTKWGPAINNKVAWVLMECPVFFSTTLLLESFITSMGNYTALILFIFRITLFSTFVCVSIFTEREKQNAYCHHVDGCDF